ncbi:hypothetical protein OC844_005996 [Tilletia horrida]|nr:hypothetical protein OC844_005996 [Tilletia horrida]
MRLSFSSALPLALAAIAAVSARSTGRNTLCANNAPVNATLEAELAVLIAAQRQRDARTAARSFNLVPVPRMINVYLHIITDGSRGLLSSSQIIAQMDVLNRDYAGAGYQFNLAFTERINSAVWFNTIEDDTTPSTIGMKSYLHRGGRADLNIYTVDLPAGSLGFATFPWDYAAPPKYMDGVVVDYATLPSFPAADTPFSGGRTATHEIGHWLGLFHTFQGGSCDPTDPGDYVLDTPQQQNATSGCPSVRDTCGSPGTDLVSNFMDYSDDACMQSFTSGQVSRMHALWVQYRGL